MKIEISSTECEEVKISIDVFDADTVATVTWPDDTNSEHSLQEIQDFADVFQTVAERMRRNQAKGSV